RKRRALRDEPRADGIQQMQGTKFATRIPESAGQGIKLSKLARVGIACRRTSLAHARGGAAAAGRISVYLRNHTVTPFAQAVLAHPRSGHSAARTRRARRLSRVP